MEEHIKGHLKIRQPDCTERTIEFVAYINKKTDKFNVQFRDEELSYTEIPLNEDLTKKSIQKYFRYYPDPSLDDEEYCRQRQCGVEVLEFKINQSLEIS